MYIYVYIYTSVRKAEAIVSKISRKSALQSFSIMNSVCILWKKLICHSISNSSNRLSVCVKKSCLIARFTIKIACRADNSQKSSHS